MFGREGRRLLAHGIFGRQRLRLIVRGLAIHVGCGAVLQLMVPSLNRKEPRKKHRLATTKQRHLGGNAPSLGRGATSCRLSRAADRSGVGSEMVTHGKAYPVQQQLSSAQQANQAACAETRDVPCCDVWQC